MSETYDICICRAGSPCHKGAACVTRARLRGEPLLAVDFTPARDWRWDRQTCDYVTCPCVNRDCCLRRI